jgi:hypothetical protein
LINNYLFEIHMPSIMYNQGKLLLITGSECIKHIL